MAFSNPKRFGAVAALALTALTLTACGQAPAPAGSTAGATGAADAKDFTACMVSDQGGFDDKSFNQLSHDGLVEAETTLGITTLEAESKSPDDFEPNITAMVQAGCDIIVPVGFMLADATQAAATANPDVDFAIVDVDYLKGDNVLGLNYDTAQAAFLAGYAAAASSKTGVVATYGGAQIPSVTIFMDGFANGVKKYNEAKGKNVQVLGWDVAAQTGSFVGDFENQTQANQITQGFLAQNADIILPVGGPLYQGGAEAIKASGKEAFIIGVDSDLAARDTKYADIIMTSITKSMDKSVLEAITESFEGTFKGGTYTGTLENDGVGLAPFGAFEPRLPAGTLDEIEALKADIIAGKITDLSPSSPKA
ncbi:Membrane lipoprotein TmpC [Pseudoclavibacter triregionum]|nr:Membrane lipoprotein TmpC [Pseudoclavibacter triregionum]